MEKILVGTQYVKLAGEKLNIEGKRSMKKALASKIGQYLLANDFITFELRENENRHVSDPVTYQMTGTIIVTNNETIKELEELLNPSTYPIEMSEHRQLIDGNRLMQLLSPFKRESDSDKHYRMMTRKSCKEVLQSNLNTPLYDETKEEKEDNTKED